MTKATIATFFVADMEPRLRPYANVKTEVLEKCLKNGITAEYVSHFENIKRWKRGDEKILKEMIKAKYAEKLVQQIPPGISKSTKKPKKSTTSKVPMKKRVVTPPLNPPLPNDENSPPESAKPRVRTPPTETSALQPTTPSMSEFPVGNQTMSAEKTFRPISDADFDQI